MDNGYKISRRGFIGGAVAGLIAVAGVDYGNAEIMNPTSPRDAFAEPVQQGSAAEVYIPKIIASDLKNPYTIDGKNTPHEWDGVNVYGNVSPGVFGKTGDVEGIAKIVRDVERKKIGFLVEDFRSSELTDNQGNDESYVINFTFRQFLERTNPKPTPQDWSLAFLRCNNGSWKSSFSYGNYATENFPVIYSNLVDANYGVHIGTSEESITYKKRPHVILELELDLVDEKPELPLKEKYGRTIPPLCLKDPVGIDIRVYKKTSTPGQLSAGNGEFGPYPTLPMLNEIPEAGKPWKRFWPLFIDDFSKFAILYTEENKSTSAKPDGSNQPNGNQSAVVQPFGNQSLPKIPDNQTVLNQSGINRGNLAQTQTPLDLQNPELSLSSFYNSSIFKFLYGFPVALTVGGLIKYLNQYGLRREEVSQTIASACHEYTQGSVVANKISAAKTSVGTRPNATKKKNSGKK